MLVVDPLKRALIADLRTMPWFFKNLPAYLTLDFIKKETGEVDHDIVLDLKKKTGFSKRTIEHALKEEETNQISVAYQVYLN